MTRILCAALLWTLILGACAPVFPSTEVVPQQAPPVTPPSPTSTEAPTEAFPESPALPIPKFSRTFETPHIDQPPDGPVTEAPPGTQQCAYQWAYQDLPELSSSFLQSIRDLQLEAQAVAFAFGENCVYADGSATFLPMETDFNVTLQAGDLADHAELGEWIVKVMQIIEAIPPEQIQGPRPGRVSIIFEANGEQSAVNFYIDQYRALGTGLSYAQIYQALLSP